MSDYLRIRAERDGDQVRVCLFETEIGSDDVWSVLDIVLADDCHAAVHFLTIKHQLDDYIVLVQDNEGNWVDPEFISTYEALEATL